MLNWNSFEPVNENLQKALKILRDNKVSEDNKNFLKLREILRRNTGYLGKFTEWMIVQKKSIESLEELYKKIKEARIKKSIDSFKTPEEVIDYLIREDSSIAVNQIITSIPSKTRNYLKSDGCDSCGGDGVIICEECDGGELECDCRDEGCEECDGDGAVMCEKCDGNGEFECDECDGHNPRCESCEGSGGVECKNCRGKGCDECYDEGEVDCEKCNANGYINCKKCGGDGYRKCEECNGEGNKSCIKCASKECKKCGGDGFYKCKVCNGKVKYECEDCKNGTYEWRSFLDFLKLHANKKDLICDFLSKKGGRYGEDGDYYDDDEGPLHSLRKDIEKLINLPSIETIKKNLPNESDVRFIYDDDKVLVIASNYEGLQKYGSSYWCITQNRNTFGDYVYEYGLKQQWIIFMKEKSPYVDDRSVMGVTIDILSGDVSAAHWEDDHPAESSIAEKIFSKVDLSKVIEAESIFEREGELHIKKFRNYFFDI